MATPYSIKVYDVRPDGHSSLGTLPRLAEGDLDKLQAFYKFQLDFTYGWDRALPGQLFWSIDAFELKAGPAVLQPQTRLENGVKAPGILLFLYWPGGVPIVDPVDPPYHQPVNAGFTNVDGTIGWGFGPESYIGGDGGPFSVWASSDPTGPDWPDRRVGSDAVKKLGWWDEHIIPNPIFQVMRKPGTTPPPVGSEYLVYLNADGSVRSHVALVPGVPAPGSEALGLWRGGQVAGHVPVTAGAPAGQAQSLVARLLGRR